MRYHLYVYIGNFKELGMPEHREGTPAELRDLESFLWHDFNTMAAWQDWIGHRGFDRHPAETSFADAGEVQKALRQLEALNNGLTEPADTLNAMNTLNQLIEQHALRPKITADGVRVDAGPGDPVGHVLQVAIQAMTTYAWPRFKLCQDPACRASFFDSSKNGSKIWCSMELCGSRNKMRRHRRKRIDQRRTLRNENLPALGKVRLDVITTVETVEKSACQNRKKHSYPHRSIDEVSIQPAIRVDSKAPNLRNEIAGLTFSTVSVGFDTRARPTRADAFATARSPFYNVGYWDRQASPVMTDIQRLLPKGPTPCATVNLCPDNAQGPRNRT